MPPSKAASAKFSDEMLHMCAQYYYVEGFSQVEVAKLIGVSQAQISRLLSEARNRGIVRIHVADYESRDRESETGIKSALGLKEVCVIKAARGISVEYLHKTIAHFAAPAVDVLISKSKVVGIAGGRTLSAVVHEIAPKAPAPNLKICQNMGNIGAVPDSFDALVSGQHLAKIYDASFHMINTPAFLPDEATRKAFMALDQIKSVFDLLARAELLLVGIGTLKNSVFISRKTLAKDDIRELTDSGAVGEICGRYYDADGNECETHLSTRVMGLNLETIRRAGNVVAFVSGSDRSEAIIAAARGKLINSLYIDEIGAKALMAALQEK